MTAFYDRVDPEELSGEQLDWLLSMGWYRMHQSMFTVSHLDYDIPRRVHWLRMSVPEIIEHRSHRRIRHRAESFTVRIEPFTVVAAEHENLYARYRAQINFDGADSVHWSMFGPESGENSIFQTHVISIRDGDRLIAGGYFDTGEISAASILHFFDPEYARYSLGKYLMLVTIDYLQEWGFQYYYPGYLVSGWEKMHYKLFLGREQTEYHDPESMEWLPFDESILGESED